MAFIIRTIEQRLRQATYGSAGVVCLPMVSGRPPAEVT